MELRCRSFLFGFRRFLFERRQGKGCVGLVWLTFLFDAGLCLTLGCWACAVFCWSCAVGVSCWALAVFCLRGGRGNVLLRFFLVELAWLSFLFNVGLGWHDVVAQSQGGGHAWHSNQLSLCRSRLIAPMGVMAPSRPCWNAAQQSRHSSYQQEGLVVELWCIGGKEVDSNDNKRLPSDLPVTGCGCNGNVAGAFGRMQP